MILIVTPENRHAHAAKLQDYFRIRKQVFHDHLGWDVVIDDDCERDIYDQLPCHYILSLSRDGMVQGGLRQMPMTGPTLTWGRFADMIADPLRLFAKDVWETTRFAVRPEDRDIRFMSGVNRIAIELSAAALDMGLRFGARRHVAVCEERVVQLTKSFRIPCEILGRRKSDGGEDILCVAWEVSDESAARLEWARSHFEAA
jgi:acyl homoserine lactone synthase